jgi:hypothetical protein
MLNKAFLALLPPPLGEAQNSLIFVDIYRALLYTRLYRC